MPTKRPLISPFFPQWLYFWRKDWLGWSMKPVSAFLQEPQLWHSKERENLPLFCKENFGLHGGPHLMPHKSYGVWKTTTKKCYKSCKLRLSTETRKLSVFGSGPAKSIPEQSENEMHCTKPFFKLEVDVFKVYIKAGKYWNSIFVVYHVGACSGGRSLRI